MSIGTIQIQQTKSGKAFKVLAAHAKSDAKFHNVPNSAWYFDRDKAADGDQAEVEFNISGQVTKCTIPGKEASPPAPKHKQSTRNSPPQQGGRSSYPQNRPPRAGAQGGSPVGGGGTVLKDATAPYNFIPYFHEAVLPMPEAEDAEGYLSGVIRCRLEAKTPFLISSGQQRQETASNQCNFFSVNGNPYIPGSSIKGMIRSLVEILSFSFIRPLNKKPLFWRRVNRPDYRNAFPQGLQGGYLKKNGSEYSLTPVNVKAVPVGEGAPAGKERFKTGGIEVKKQASSDYHFTLPTDQDSPKFLDREIMAKFLLQLTDSQKIRWKKMDAEKKLNGQVGVPVFYLTDESGYVSEIGLCRYFRRAYKHNPAAVCAHNDAPDFSTCLLGTVRGQAHKGRVAFESALVQGELDTIKGHTVVLSEPHPTCLAHYVDQTDAKIKTMSNGTKNDPDTFWCYNDDLPHLRLRGRKWYWHHDVDESIWPSGTPTMSSTLFPMAKGSTAELCIRVERVTDIELGALLEALDLPEGHAHKLGMGKPLGFGSVRLDVSEVSVKDTRQHYASLKQRLGQKLAPTMDKSTQDAFRQSFCNYVLKNVQQAYAEWKHVQKYDDLPPIATLRLMMDFVNRPAPEKVKYMELADFKKQALLQKPYEIVTKKS